MSTTSNAEKKKTSEILPYACVHCGTPCASLYRRLSVSLSSIKAMSCSNCEKIVDPYIEREWLLVAIDCVLLRPEAYRHLLFNVDEFKEVPLGRALQFLFFWALLDAFLKWEAVRNESSSRIQGLVQDKAFVCSLAASSYLGMIIQWSTLYFCMKKKRKNSQIPSLSTKILLAVLLPSSFSVITTFVLIWENTKTVRLLGSLMVTAWQGIALSVLTEDIKIPLLGLFAGVLWRLLVSTFWMQHLPCIGLELNLLGASSSLCVT